MNYALLNNARNGRIPNIASKYGLSYNQLVIEETCKSMIKRHQSPMNALLSTKSAGRLLRRKTSKVEWQMPPTTPTVKMTMIGGGNIESPE